MLSNMDSSYTKYIHIYLIIGTTHVTQNVQITINYISLMLHTLHTH